MKFFGIKYLMFAVPATAICFCAFITGSIQMKLRHPATLDSLGACQGVSYQNGRVFLYGDREVGMMREYKLISDSLVYQHKEYRLTLNHTDVINHPTGIAYNGSGATFMGNSIRLNAAGTKWRAVIYCIDWNGLLKTGTLDGNLINIIDDDACIQGTRPEYVKYHKKWFVATADYGDHGNEVRLYDPEKLKHTKKTSEKGVLFKKFICTPWVQNLNWIADKNILVLIQNKNEGRRWRFTYVDLEKSIEAGEQKVIKVIDIDERNDELEGFTFLGSTSKGVAVTSARINNVNYMDINW